MNADRTHGFCEGMAVAVGIAALGFIVIKEMDAFFERRAAHDILGFRDVTRNMNSRPAFDNIRVTRHMAPLDFDAAEIQELVNQMVHPHGAFFPDPVQNADEGGDETSGPNDEGSTTGHA